MSRRSEILRAVAEAAKLLNRFPVGERTSFDVIAAVAALDIPLLFRPLKGLWGAAITVDGGSKGILVTSKLDLHVQRFTLAHELGHVLLGHEMSFDETVGMLGRYGPTSRPDQEFAADTFASELLAPKALAMAAAKRHGWTKARLSQPETVYQLSLRLGMSYQATCWALVVHRVLSQETARHLQGQAVKGLKRAFAPAALITNSWADVWELTEGDSGTFVEAGPDDLFAVHLQDNASAGFLWQLVDTGTGAEIVGEQSAPVDDNYGERASRIVFIRFPAAGVHRLSFEHVRPWSGVKVAHIDVEVDGHGKEVDGLARRIRSEAVVEA